MTRPAPTSLRLARALALLAVGPQDADGPALAEALWLARRLPAAAPPPPAAEAAPPVVAPPPSAAPAGTPPPDVPPPAAPPPPPAAPERVALFAPQIDTAGTGSLRGARVRVPAADALPQAAGIERALRPFMRRYPSRVLRELDPAATAQASAERQQVTPVFRPQPERWFDVALVLDDSESMAVWGATARELKALLARHGAFRQVHLWRLRAGGGRVVLHSEAGLDTGARTLAGEEGRTLVLLLTHGTGAGWRDDLLGAWLRDLARRATVALVQMLPRHAWPYTALGDATERVLSRERAAPNRRLRLRDPIAGNWIAAPGVEAFPALPLDAAAIAHWAQFVMAPRRLDHPALWIGPGSGAVQPAGGAAATADARQRIERFRANASAEAFALLRLLAMAPVTLPVMRLLQRVGGGAPSAAPLAEVLLSGLLQRVHTGASEEEHVYGFDPDVSDWLAGGLSGTERRSVDAALDPTREKLREFVERQSGRRVKDFSALVLDPQGDELLPAEARAFVEVSRRLYAKQGVLPAGMPDRSAAAAGNLAVKASTTAHKLLRVALLRGDDLRRPPPLESALRAALAERGHEVVTAGADVVVLITESSAAADADVIVMPETAVASVVESVEGATPQGALHGWPAAPERAVSRSGDAKRLHAQLATQLLGAGADRAGPGRAKLLAAPMSGARHLLGEVLSDFEWRSRFPGGIWLDQAPPTPALRRGPRLIVVEGKRAAVDRADAVLTLTYSTRAGARVDIGYLDADVLRIEFVRRGLEPERLDAAIEISRGIPLLVGATAVALQRGATPPGELPEEPSARFDAVVRWMLAALVREERDDLLFMAARQPEAGRLNEVQHRLAFDLGWLHEDADSAWLQTDARRALGRADPGGLRAGHESLLQALRVPGERTQRYAARYLLLHLWSARGEAGVLADLRNVTVMRPLLDIDRAAVMDQLRTLVNTKPPPPQLRRVLSLWEQLTDHFTMPTANLAEAIARLAGAEPVRTWQAPPGTGIADAVRAGVTGAGITVWVPSTGCDPKHPALQGAQLSGDLGDKQGHGTAVISLIASPRQGVAPGVRVQVTRILDDQGSGDMATMLRAVLAMLDRRDDELPQIACWALGQSISGPSLDGLQRELAAALRALAERGTLIVTAAGNESAGRFSFPAVLPWVLAVGACDARGEPAAFSSRGDFPIRKLEGVDDHERKMPDLYGYGVDIPVAVVGRRATFQQQSGTSFAAAYVAGIAALWAQSSGLRGDDLKWALIGSADEHGVARWRPAPAAGSAEGMVKA